MTGRRLPVRKRQYNNGDSKVIAVESNSELNISGATTTPSSFAQTEEYMDSPSGYSSTSSPLFHSPESHPFSTSGSEDESDYEDEDINDLKNEVSQGESTSAGTPISPDFATQPFRKKNSPPLPPPETNSNTMTECANTPPHKPPANKKRKVSLSPAAIAQQMTVSVLESKTVPSTKGTPLKSPTSGSKRRSPRSKVEETAIAPKMDEISSAQKRARRQQSQDVVTVADIEENNVENPNQSKKTTPAVVVLDNVDDALGSDNNTSTTTKSKAKETKNKKKKQANSKQVSKVDEVSSEVESKAMVNDPKLDVNASLEKHPTRSPAKRRSPRKATVKSDFKPLKQDENKDESKQEFNSCDSIQKVDQASATNTTSSKKPSNKKRLATSRSTKSTTQTPSKKTNKVTSSKATTMNNNKTPQLSDDAQNGKPLDKTPASSRSTPASCGKKKGTTTTKTNTTSAASTKAAKPIKKKKRTFQDELLTQMFVSCRPFTVKALAKQMNTNDSSIEHCMLSLVDKQWVIKKEFTSKGGRTKELYWANQKAVTKANMAKTDKKGGLMDALQFVSSKEIKDATQELGVLKDQEAKLAKDLVQVLQEPSNDELVAQLRSSEEEVQDLERRLTETKSRIESFNKQSQQRSKMVGPNHPNNKRKTTNQRRIKKQFNAMRGEWKKRKDKCMDFVDQLADGMEKKVKDVVKLLELETDESEGVKLPPRYVID